MIAGRGTPDQAPARLFAYRSPDHFQLLIDRLVEGSIAYLSRQIEAGVEVVQIFDTWAGVLPAGEFEHWCEEPVARIIAAIRKKFAAVPIIAFPRGAGLQIAKFAERTGADAIGLDTSVDLQDVARRAAKSLPLQGNLDPLALVAGGRALDEAILRISRAMQGRPHIFNLGHGILPETPISHVEQMLRRVRQGA